MWSHRRHTAIRRVYLREHNPRGVHDRKSQTFRAEFSTGTIHSAQGHACGKRVPVASSRVFPRTGTGPTRPDPPIPDTTNHTDDLRPSPRVSYHSCVCSIMGDDAIGRIAEAIDQLDRDVHGAAAGPELIARLADIWLMMSALDPEIARLQQAYVTPPDGTPH